MWICNEDKMAEFIIKTQGNKWMESLPVESWATKNLTQEQYDARSEKGDLVQVMTDGQVYWFNNHPQFVLIRVPELDYKKSKETYEGGLYEETIDSEGRTIQKMRKKRKFFVSPEIVDEAIANNGELKMAPEDFEKVLTERTLNEEKVVITKTVSLISVMKEIYG